MQSEIYAAIQIEWRKISNDEHRSLLYEYLVSTNHIEDRSWMEFLRAHFNIEERPVLRLFNPHCGEARFKSAA